MCHAHPALKVNFGIEGHKWLNVLHLRDTFITVLDHLLRSKETWDSGERENW